MHHDGHQQTIEADDEREARRLAMVAKYGLEPNDIVPHAPDYEGRGLLITVLPEPQQGAI